MTQMRCCHVKPEIARASRLSLKCHSTLFTSNRQTLAGVLLCQSPSSLSVRHQSRGTRDQLNMAQNQDQGFNNNASVVRDDEGFSVCRVSPWINKQEFIDVYNGLFCSDGTAELRQQAYNGMLVWKVRRQYLTPASVLSTIAIVDVQMQTETLLSVHCPQQLANNKRILRQLYANAFTRFLNYMSSILQTRQLKTMYTTASELGLDSFVVDLRHLCAHGHDLPQLEIFQHAGRYLLDWLHDFYWRRELQHIENADAADVRPAKLVEFEEYVQSLLEVYDTATEASLRGCRVLSDLRGGQPFGDEQQAWSLKKYGVYHKLDRLSVIAGRVTNELTQLAAKESRVRGNDEVFCAVLLRCRHFMETPASRVAKAEKQSNGTAIPPPTNTTTANTAANGKAGNGLNELIAVHQNLFRALAVCGFIEPCFRQLIAICEDEHETERRRRSAQFWAEQVAAGFAVFREVKRVFKARKERNAEFEMDLAPLNTDSMSPAIRAVYKSLGVNCGGVLIFGDTIRRPWTLTFSRDFMAERVQTVNAYTLPVLRRCLELVEPPLMAAEAEQLRLLMTVMAREAAGGLASDGTIDDGASQCTAESSTTADEVYAVGEDGAVEAVRLEQVVELGVADEAIEAGAAPSLPEPEAETYGLFKEVSDDYVWKSLPLGLIYRNH